MNETVLPNITGVLQNKLGDIVPSLIAVLGILFFGWIVASLLSALSRKAFQALNKWAGESSDGGFEHGMARGVFWAVFLFAALIAINKFNNPMLSQTFSFLPRLIKAGILALAAWFIATIVRVVTSKALSKVAIEKKFADLPGKGDFSNNIATILSSFVILLFIPAILGALQMDGLLLPIQDMVQKMLGTLPNIFAAAMIGIVGWFIAKVLRNISSTLLTTAGVDEWSAKLGFTSDTSLAGMGGLVVFLMVFIPVLIAALNALGIDAISRPATDMLQKIMTAIPNLIAASALLGITFYVGRFAASSVSMLLKGMGFDALPAKLGFTLSGDSLVPSVLASKAILFFMMLFATVEAANMLGFSQVRDVVTMFIKFGGQILLGAVIFAVGFWLSNVAKSAVLASGAQSGAATLVRFTIIGLVTAMGLRAMGLADDIVNLAFGLTLGAVAVAFALSFGLGGREAAGKHLDFWLSNLRK